MPTSVLRLRTVLERTGCSRSGLYARIPDGLFPRPIALGARAAAWPKHDIDAVLAAMIRGATDEEMRTLVSDILARRSNFSLRANPRALATTNVSAAQQTPARL
jgi:prophage regulatory protein